MPFFRRAIPPTVVLAAAFSLATVARAADSFPDQPSVLTNDTQVQYAKLVMPEPDTIKPNQYWNDPLYNLRRLHQEFKYPIKFTWDAGALNYFTKSNWLMVNFIEDTSLSLVNPLTSDQKVYFQKPMSKIKEVHLTTTNQGRAGSDDIKGDGVYPTFNKTTGVLTLALSTTDGVNRDPQGGRLGPWILANVK